MRWMDIIDTRVMQECLAQYAAIIARRAFVAHSPAKTYRINFFINDPRSSVRKK